MRAAFILLIEKRAVSLPPDCELWPPIKREKKKEEEYPIRNKWGHHINNISSAIEMKPEEGREREPFLPRPSFRK